VFVKGAQTDLLALVQLHVHVTNARGIVAHENRAESARATLRGESGRAISEFHLDASRESFSVK
jgi:hypothetical protein